MHGILKSSHQRLCDCLNEFKEMESIPDHRLNEMEEELCAVFLSYQKKIIELKQLINRYDENQKLIRFELKRLKKHSLV